MWNYCKSPILLSVDTTFFPMKTSPARFPLLFLLLLFTFACQQQQEAPYSMDSVEQEAIPEADQQTGSDDEVSVTERKLIKEGWVTFETEDLTTTRANILTAIEAHKGYLSSDQESNSGDRMSATLVIRVPSDQFDALLTDVSEGVNRFENKDIRVKDVTAEFLDIQARLKTKKELESRYLALLKQARTVTEILEIEKQIGQLRAEIESVEGRLKYLKNQVSFSTLTLTVYEQVASSIGFGRKFSEGFANGWENLIWFFVGLTNIWPFLILIAGFLGFFWWRRKKKQE